MLSFVRVDICGNGNVEVMCGACVDDDDEALAPGRWVYNVGINRGG